MMPCRSDYLAASGQEQESQRVCGLLVHIHSRLELAPPDQWVVAASMDYYGNVARLDEATAALCSMCRRLSPAELESVIYDAHDKTSRELASWWERHQEWDARRVKEEGERRKRIVTRQRALQKLSVEEMEALGL